MNFQALAKGFTTCLAKIKFKGQKYSPELLLTAGIIGSVTSAVMACKAVKKTDKLVEERDEKFQNIEDNLKADPDEFTEDDVKLAKVRVKVEYYLGYVKTFGPSIALGLASIGCLLGSHHIMHGRNVALAASYAALNEAFEKYRSRVADKLGEEAEKAIRYGATEEKIEELITDSNGKEVKKKVKTNVVGNPGEYSPYARFFDESSRNWQKDARYNLQFLRMMEDMFTDKLRTNGYVFLNDIYTALDIETCPEGQTIGWVYDPESDISDNFVDLGLYNGTRKKTRDFINGYEKVFIIDPNVDGDIMSRAFNRKAAV